MAGDLKKSVIPKNVVIRAAMPLHIDAKVHALVAHLFAHLLVACAACVVMRGPQTHDQTSSSS